MAKFITANRTLSAALVPDSLCNIRIRKIIDQATKDLIDKLLLEKIPLAGIARVAGISEPWLQSYVNAKYQAVSRQINVWVLQ